jgi:CRP/FNR family cyclic AMP-dependent transcriptional regulator
MSMLKRLLGRGTSVSAPARRQGPLPLWQYLSRMDIFQGLSREEVEGLFARSALRQYPKGALLFAPDDPAEYLYVLKEGTVELYRLSEEGKRLNIRRMGPESIFGEMGLLGQTLHGCFAEATEPSLVCVATRESVEEMLVRHPRVAVRLLRVVGQRLREAEDQLARFAFRPVQARLAAFLLQHCDEATGNVHGFTHEEIGESIGALRSTVTQSLGELARAGVVEVKHKCVRVRDLDALRAIAVEEYATAQK